MYELVTNLSQLPNFTLDFPVFSDIETEGLYINVRLIQLYQPTTSDLVYTLDMDKLNLDEVKAILKPLWTVWHRASYDLGTLNMHTAKIDDTLYLARNAFPEIRDFTLDNVVGHLGYNHLYDGIDKKKMQKQGFVKGAYLSALQLRYAATDVIALSKIWDNAKIQACRNILSYKVDMASICYAVMYQQNGLLVNQLAVRTELDKLVDVIAENKVKLGSLNPNSPKQVKIALGTDSSDKATLVKLIATGNETARLVYEQRRLLKREGFLQSYNYPKVFTRFTPGGATTGRFTATGGDMPRGINAQQITRDLQYIFNTDTEDTVVIHADYSTAELRAGCSIMNEPTMYQELKDKKDLHIEAAAMALGIDPKQVTKKDRQKGKAISFGFIFGMSADSFVEYAYVNYGVIFTPEEAKAIKKKYDTKYQNIAAYHKIKWNNYKTQPVVTPLGKRAMANLGTDAINFATQGGIAETTKLAVHYLCRDHAEAIKYIYNVVHDAIYLRVPRGMEEVWADYLISSMKKAWVEICKCDLFNYKDIEMPVEIEYNGKVRVA